MSSKPTQYCVVLTQDNCDPSVLGPFDTEDAALAAAEAERQSWTDDNWRHDPYTHVCELWTPTEGGS